MGRKFCNRFSKKCESESFDEMDWFAFDELLRFPDCSVFQNNRGRFGSVYSSRGNFSIWWLKYITCWLTIIDKNARVILCPCSKFDVHDLVFWQFEFICNCHIFWHFFSKIQKVLTVNTHRVLKYSEIKKCRKYNTLFFIKKSIETFREISFSLANEMII